jgi:ABC-type glycerol-3-phosphate transport system substrate-binding protein
MRPTKLIALAAMMLLAGGLAFAGGTKESAPAAGQQPVELVFWWWGEQEAPGLEGWLKETVAQFEQANPSIKVNTVLQATENVIDDFTTASAAGTPPDLQYLWNGIYHQENVWLGYIEPLDDWIPKDELRNMWASDLSFYQGKQYRAGWYLLPMGMMYNKKLLKEAGLPPEFKEPVKWDDFMAACATLKKAGITPMGAGFKDGFWGEWFTGFGLVQNEDNVNDTTKLVIGQYSFKDPRWHEHWTRLEQLIKAGYINEDANSLDLYQGIALMQTGKAAVTQSILTLVPATEKELGAENVGIMGWPVWGKGKLAGLPVIDVQGVGISSQSKHKKEAAEFIRFMHRDDRSTALYQQVSIFPADKRWKGDQFVKGANNVKMWKWFTGTNTGYIPNMIAWTFDSEVMYTAPQLLIAGETTAEQIAAHADEVMARWREENPDLLEGHKKWAAVQ